MTTQARTPASAAVYTRSTLAVYDLFVLGFSNRYAWGCPSSDILAHYNQHVSAKHLDVGVGTGYFLDKCQFPSATPSITLADLNPNSLAVSAKRIERYQPKTEVVDVLGPLAIKETFDSVALNYLLHCLPGDMTDKRGVLERLRARLEPGGVLFGTTILGEGVKHNFIGQKLMDIYNKKGIFSNDQDSFQSLEKNLSEVFGDYEIDLEGRVALFSARG